MAIEHLNKILRPATGDESVSVFTSGLSVPEDDVVAAWALLSPEERDRADRFAFRSDRNRFVVSRAGLRHLLGERLGMTPESVQFSYGKFGKPALANQPGDSDLRFNVSHSGDLVVYALADGREIGVDVEAIAAMEDRDDVATHCFSKAEQDAYLALAESERTQGFFNCWTRKEAYIKARGDGLSLPLDQFDVTLLSGQPVQILSTRHDPGEHLHWQLRDLNAGHGYKAALAVRTPTLQLHYWDWPAGDVT